MKPDACCLGAEGVVGVNDVGAVCWPGTNELTVFAAPGWKELEPMLNLPKLYKGIKLGSDN